MPNDNCFYSISNEDIFKKLCSIERKVDNTCNKAKIALWMASTSLTISLLVCGVLLRS